MKYAVVVGHSPEESGAYSQILGRTEFDYNKEVASYLEGVADIYYRPRNGGYKSQMKALAKEINPKGYDFVFELHFNAFNGKAEGVEALIWAGNKKSEDMAKKYTREVSSTFRTVNRGVKPISKENERGYWFLQSMSANALILEPFFGDNIEAEKFINPALYAAVIKSIICE